MKEEEIYSNPFRPNYEAKAAAGWVLSIPAMFYAQQAFMMPVEPFLWMAGLAGTFAVMRLPDALNLRRVHKSLQGKPLAKISLETLKKTLAKHPDEIWLGKGFKWETKHVQRAFEIIKRSESDVVSKKLNENIKGKPWIHGLELKESDIFQKVDHFEGHLMILGTTGAGKTRMFDLLVSQAILRGESVFIVDPKGDRDLMEKARKVCEDMGQPDRFVMFHPAFPDQSVRIDVLQNFTRPTEIATRIAALIPSENAGGDPFTAFSWQALNHITNALLMVHEKPTLLKLRLLLEGGVESLVAKAIEAYAKKVYDKDLIDRDTLNEFRKAATEPHPQKAASKIMRLYYENLAQVAPSGEIEGLLSMYKHDNTHFSKMVASLLPVMNMLTAGDLADLLSPDPEDMSDKREITHTAKMINARQVVYIALDNLTDGMVGSAIGSLILSDMTSVAGQRYNFGVHNEPVNLFIDEAAEVLNDPTIQLANKGRGSKFRLILATQTINDFAVKLGSTEKAMQMAGNFNNLISLRVIDPETQEFVTKNLHTTRVKYIMQTQGSSSDSESPIITHGNLGERLMEEEMELFPPTLLGDIPDLEFVAKLAGGNFYKSRIPIIEV